MQQRPAYVIGRHRYAFRSGKAALILGVKLCKPDGKGDWRPCYHVQYEDGTEDYVATESVTDGDYEIIAAELQEAERKPCRP